MNAPLTEEDYARLDEEAAAWERAREESEERIRARALEFDEHFQALALSKARTAAEHLRIPPVQDDTVTALLTREFPDEPTAIDGFLGRDQSALFGGAFKTGKTSVESECARCLADGEPFLGLYDTHLEGNVGITNAEMGERDYAHYLRPLGIRNTDAVRVWHLRGYALNLMADAGCEAAVKWLRRNEIGFWFLDPYSSVLAWSGVDENSNDEVARFLVRLDTVKVEAGVRELVVVAHYGRQEFSPGSEHVRGASKLDDWADVRWNLTKDELDNRFISAMGRGIETDECRLLRDPETHRFTVSGGDRRTTIDQERVDEVVAIVTASPGINAGSIYALLKTTKNRNEQSKAVLQARQSGRVFAQKNGTAWEHFAVDPDASSVPV